MAGKSKSKKPLDPQAGSPGQRDRLHAATRVQSSVEPEGYPASERRQHGVLIRKRGAAE